MKRHNIISYPVDSAQIIALVDTQGLYCHTLSIVYSLPHISETAKSMGTITHRSNPFSRDCRRNGNEVTAVTEQQKLLKYERIERSVPQDLYQLACMYSCPCSIIVPYQRPLTAPYPSLPVSLRRVSFE